MINLKKLITEAPVKLPLEKMASQFKKDRYKIYGTGKDEISVENKEGFVITFKRNRKGKVDAFVQGYKTDIPVDDVGNAYKDMRQFLDSIDQGWIEDNDPHADKW